MTPVTSVSLCSMLERKRLYCVNPSPLINILRRWTPPSLFPSPPLTVPLDTLRRRPIFSCPRQAHYKKGSYSAMGYDRRLLSPMGYKVQGHQLSRVLDPLQPRKPDLSCSCRTSVRRSLSRTSVSISFLQQERSQTQVSALNFRSIKPGASVATWDTNSRQPPRSIASITSLSSQRSHSQSTPYNYVPTSSMYEAFNHRTQSKQCVELDHIDSP